MNAMLKLGPLTAPMPAFNDDPAGVCERCQPLLDEALEVAQSDADQKIASNAADMTALMDDLKSQLDQVRAEIEASHARVIETCLRAVLPKLASVTTRLELEAAVKAEVAGPSGRLEIRAHPENKMIADWAAVQTDAHFDFVGDDEMAATQTRLIWNDGESIFDVSAMVAACLAILEPNHE